MATQASNDKEIHEGKFFAVISYIVFLCIVSLVLKKENKFALHHAKQGLVLFVLEVVCFILSIVPILGWLMATLGVALFTFYSVWGVVQALMGSTSRLFVISDIADNIVL